jgi:hypothetical protein
MACASPEYLSRHGEPQSPSQLSDHALIGHRDPVAGQLDSLRFQDPADGRAIRSTILKQPGR